MKKWLVLVCIFAFAAPVAAAEVDPDAVPVRETIGPEFLYPGDVFNGYSELEASLWADYDLWIFACIGTDTFEVDVTDYGGNPDTTAAILIEYGAGMVEFDTGTYPASATVSDDVTELGIYIVVAGYMDHPGGHIKGYYLDAAFGSGSTGDCTPPPYNPSKWNDGGSVQYNNNCYNYANDEITMTFAQPGKWGGCYPWSISCSNVYDAAQCDGLVPISGGSATCPDSMHRVYLVTRPGWDYHWYRQDTDGYWSHKPGSTPARDYDDSYQSISNPSMPTQECTRTTAATCAHAGITRPFSDKT